MTEILISLREAIEVIESVPEGNWKPSRYIKELEKLNPVQPEIVLCKDCEKFFWSGCCEPVGEKFKPIYRCRRNYDRVYPDGFCSYAVRKEDE